MFEMLPYGANIIVKSTSSNISSKFSIGRPDYVTSMVTPSIITFSYNNSNNNGILYNIETNLNLISWDKNNKTFTLSNEGKMDIKPYIKLQCDNVKIPINFIAIPNEDQTHWTKSKWFSYSDEGDKLCLNGYFEGDYVKVAKELTINWSTTTNAQQIILEKHNTQGYGEYYTAFAYYQYYDNNNNILQDEIRILNTQVDPQHTLVVPKLNGQQSTLISKYEDNGEKTVSKTLRFINYFTVGILVQIFDGYTVDNSITKNYIDNITHYVYDVRGFLRENNFSYRTYLENDKGIPNKYSNLKIAWNSDFFYKTKQHEDCDEDSIYYISPSTSIIKNDWEFDYDYNSYDPPTCTGKSDEDGTTYTEYYWELTGVNGKYRIPDDNGSPSSICQMHEGTFSGYDEIVESLEFKNGCYKIDSNWWIAEGNTTSHEQKSRQKSVDCGGSVCTNECPYDCPEHDICQCVYPNDTCMDNYCTRDYCGGYDPQHPTYCTTKYHDMGPC